MNIEQYKKNKNNQNRTGEINNLAEANIKLMDKLKWIREDIQREIYKLENPTFSDIFTKEEIVDDLKAILKNNN